MTKFENFLFALHNKLKQFLCPHRMKPYQLLILENERYVASGFIQDNGQDEIRDRDRPEEDRDDGRKDKFLGSIKKLFCC